MEGGAPLNDGRKNKSSDIVLPMPTMERVTVRVLNYLKKQPTKHTGNRQYYFLVYYLLVKLSTLNGRDSRHNLDREIKGHCYK
jgi:phosphatidylethanolamine-binding protein (PEBP) family uncharacterized protein